ncbi:MAG: tyrosine--tRNA ligase [Actinomycetota bacterium]|nr:tyrosine--tRNA ligase [Actinomycetota bacterium]
MPPQPPTGPGLSADLSFRGVVHQSSAPELDALLDGGRLTVYSGFDPTAPSLHVGNLLQLVTLRRLQEAGHRPIALLGGATGLIGDPGGKATERPLLSEDEHRENVAGIQPQLERFLDFSPGAGPARAVLRDNAQWLAPLGIVTFLRDVGKHFSVNQMIAKESVRARIERPDRGISYTEFSYMLLQAYDFLHLYDTDGCRMQIGGSDQWGNITMGIDLVRRCRNVEVFGLTTPLLTRSDGAKLGKTETGTVWLDAARTSPYALFQYFLNAEDARVGAYLRLLTFVPHERITELDCTTEDAPEKREAQRELARAVCLIVHDAAETARAERAAGALFSEEIAGLDEKTLVEVLADAPTTALARSAVDGGLTVVDALVTTGLAPSKGAARRTVDQGGAYVNNRRVADPNQTIGAGDLLADRYLVLRRGRKEYHLLQFG